ncbi:hypothetical protein PTSG_03663 [Salpingoeca rosetta]|uniref:Uncharacterized protein n=1 Tax=Salpingoeca rosetta (strain ATCC 50818 / BSB-021) TaxID=946362 RepID=F2U686_SALR5|nr:uncharacterized protein PTSG_03663 [Salpingoeca rosetta]EGD83027.1 hypothetical protein PTSG_03663 [Salpingoeca rosetta]|eukprot:XP_004995391.1 hypothetical protein PTSG_03663 [Salpingoeca rosetta]
MRAVQKFLAILAVALVAIGAASVVAWPDEPCRIPPGARNFTLDKYAGLWYEIGKIQTAGGADKTVTGKTIVANGTLTNTNATNPARFTESFFPFTPKVAYNVIYLDEKYSIEYDCGQEAGITNYCFHVLARKPQVPEEDVQQLLQLAVRFDLNPKNIPFKPTKQQGCWNQHQE